MIFENKDIEEVYTCYIQARNILLSGNAKMEKGNENLEKILKDLREFQKYAQSLTKNTKDTKI